MITTIGFIAAALTTASFVPQAIKTLRTRSTSDLSPAMYTSFFLGILCWLVYGILINDLPMIVANIITTGLSGTILFVILKNTIKQKATRKRKEES
jgi:MtN3 and saliva related transmembrane protein